MNLDSITTSKSMDMLHVSDSVLFDDLRINDDDQQILPSIYNDDNQHHQQDDHKNDSHHHQHLFQGHQHSHHSTNKNHHHHHHKKKLHSHPFVNDEFVDEMKMGHKPMMQSSMVMTSENLRLTLHKLHLLFGQSQRRITIFSVLYLILLCLTVNVIVISENVFFVKRVVLDANSYLVDEVTGLPNRLLLYSYNALLLVSLGVASVSGILTGGLTVHKNHHRLETTVRLNVIVSRVFAASVLCFMILISGELIMYGALAGRRMWDHYGIPFVIMGLIELCMVILVVSCVVCLWRHWRVASTMKKYASLRVACQQEAIEEERCRQLRQLHGLE